MRRRETRAPLPAAPDRPILFPVPAPDAPTESALTGQQRRFLRARIQPQKAVVQVGAAGVTPAVSKAVEQALLDHELIKVRLLEPEDKHAAAEALAVAAGAHLCGVLGHTVILYRPHPERPRIVLPRKATRARRGEAS
jgi:RNA-binding protein